MTEMRDVVIRTASVDDIEALANIYVSSARHAALDPDLYVVPEAQRVVKHLRETLDLEHAESVRLVAAVGGRVVGSARVELCSTSPVSMLRPVLAGSVDVAVHEGKRGAGIGFTLDGGRRRCGRASAARA